MANMTPINIPSAQGLFPPVGGGQGNGLFGGNFQPPSGPAAGYGRFPGGAIGAPGGIQAGAGGMGGGNASASGMTAGGPNPGGMTNMGLNAASSAGSVFGPLGWAADAGNIGKGLYYGSQGLGSQVPDRGFWGNAANAANPLSQNPSWLQQGANSVGDWLGQLFGTSPGQMGMAQGMAPSWMGTGQSSGSSMQGGGGAPNGAGNAGPGSGYGTSMPSTESQSGGGQGFFGSTFGSSSPYTVSGGYTGYAPAAGGMVNQAAKYQML